MSKRCSTKKTRRQVSDYLLSIENPLSKLVVSSEWIKLLGTRGKLFTRKERYE